MFYIYPVGTKIIPCWVGKKEKKTQACPLKKTRGNFKNKSLKVYHTCKTDGGVIKGKSCDQETSNDLK